LRHGRLGPRRRRPAPFGHQCGLPAQGPVIVRISRSGADAGSARRSVAVARWLEAVDYPAVRAVDVDQPVIVGGYVVTFWQSVSDYGDQFASTPEIAAILARLHRLTVPEGLRLPPLDPFANALLRIGANTWLTPDDRAFFTAALARLQDACAGLEFALPQGVIHGDASVGNVLRDQRGAPVLIDLDGFAIGPREWDLVQTAMYYDSFGWHTREEYEDFARVYGYDIRQWPGYPVLSEIREFLMVTWLIQKAAEDAQAAAEATKRIAALRTGASRKDWEPALLGDRGGPI
jgi:aminoglycoside phosphotransferase (APT) family kinase protein